MNLTGLTEKQVVERIKSGRANRVLSKTSDTIGKIILRNTLTVFNLVNLILALMIISVGAYKNLFFILVAIANTAISIINSIRAKRTIDKMRLVAEQKPTVIRDGKTRQIPQTDLVEGDLIILGLGDQVIVDSRVEEGAVEVNESYVTGEQDSVKKRPGDTLISGSFIVSGTCKATATAVGKDSQLAKIEHSAHTIKTADSKLFNLINNIVKYISIALIPIGALLLWARFNVPDTTAEVAVTSTVAGLISMIPEGLVLLTSSVLALATIRLSRRKVLVQDLYSVETLARVDTICLDKTGTLTTGHMKVSHFIPVVNDELQDPTNLKTPSNPAEKSLHNALMAILSTSEADNATSTALKTKLLKKAKFKPTEQILEIIPFSSDRKYSGVVTNKATYLMGAPEILLGKTPDIPGSYRVLAVVCVDTDNEREGYPLSRSIFADGANTERPKPVTDSSRKRAKNVLAHSSELTMSGRPEGSTGLRERSEKDGYLRAHASKMLGFALLEDELRGDAPEIIEYFYKNNVDIKIISGDNLKTVTTIATKVGIKNPHGIDLSTIKGDINYNKLVKDYNIFTRVKPAQKKSLVLALKKQGRTVAMTGDGVNDILAMKEADCSIAIGEGSDAARRSAKLVLLDNDFAGVPSVIDEGRQSINNLERSATLFLSKNTYAAILAVLFILIPLEYPFAPLEMSILNVACIGMPGVILALEKNTARIKNKFMTNILQFSIPTGITVAISMLILAVVAEVNSFTRPELITTSLIVTFAIDFLLIFSIVRPLNLLRSIVLIFSFTIVSLALLIPFARSFLDFTTLSPDKIFIAIILVAVAFIIFIILRSIMRHISAKLITKYPRLQL